MSLDAYLDVEERESQEVRSDTLKRLVGQILKHRGLLLAGMLLIGVNTAATLIEPRIFGYTIDEAIVPRNWLRLEQLGVAYSLTIILRVAALVGQAYLFERLGQRVGLALRLQLFAHLQRLPLNVFDRNPAGRLLTRVTNDITSLIEMFSAGFVNMVGNALLIVGILICMFTLDVRLGLIASTVFPFLAVVSVYFSRRLKVSYRDARSRLSALNAFVAENLLGMKVVNLFNRQKLHLGRYDRINQWYTDAQIGSVRVFALFQPAITLAAGISVALVMWAGGRQVQLGALKLGILVAYFSYVLSLFQPLRELAEKWNVFLSGMTSAERIFSILDWPTELEADAVRVPARALESVGGHIVFENVWFAYDAEHWVLKDFSLEIPPGTRLGVVGHTGAGKTTLISLLMRFYEPQRGRILLDGRDLREYDRRALRASIGIIQQDVFLFSGTLKDNVTFWGSQGNQRVDAALDSLGFGAAWQSEKVGSALLERGTNLSMGERQVLAFARALAVDPKVWILDEATANMDSQTELRLQAAFDGSAAGRTAILIAHRLATVKKADRIVVLHKGVLVEEGSHTQLLARDGLYARLYRYQLAQQDQANQRV